MYPIEIVLIHLKVCNQESQDLKEWLMNRGMKMNDIPLLNHCSFLYCL